MRGSLVPIAKDNINWIPSLSDNVNTPVAFLQGGLLSKAVTIKNIILPNTRLPFFIPLIRSPSAPQYSPAASSLNFTPGISQMDYYIVFRNKSNGQATVVYFNYVNNYGLVPPAVSVMTNKSTINYTYYYCYDFVADFLKTIVTQCNTAGADLLNPPGFQLGYISSDTSLQLSFAQTFLAVYDVELSRTLKTMMNFRTSTVNLGSDTTYKLLFNDTTTTINGVVSLSTFTRIDSTRITPFKAIFVCSNNFELANMNLETNSLLLANSNSVSLPPRTALFVFKDWTNGVRFDEPFKFSTDEPISLSICFNADRFTSDSFRLQVYLQMQDNVTFLPYIFDESDCVDMLLLTYMR